MTDPFTRSLGLAVPRLTANVVTISHDSPHHANFQGVGGGPRLIQGPGEYEIAGSMITGVGTPGERTGGELGKNTAYRYEMDDLELCHLGDLGKALTPDQIDALKDPDVLFLPVGGVCTVTPAEAAEIASQLEPRLIVPMHYALPGLSFNLEPVERFCREMGLVEINPQPRLAVTRSSLPETTTVVVLAKS